MRSAVGGSYPREAVAGAATTRPHTAPRREKAVRRAPALRAVAPAPKEARTYQQPPMRGRPAPNRALPSRTAVSLRSTPDPPSAAVLGYARAATSAMRHKRPTQKIISRAHCKEQNEPNQFYKISALARLRGCSRIARIAVLREHTSAFLLTQKNASGLAARTRSAPRFALKPGLTPPAARKCRFATRGPVFYIYLRLAGGCSN